MTSRRDFLRRGALWVAGAALIEPKRLWAFPSNPLANAPTVITDAEVAAVLRRIYADFRADVFPTMQKLTEVLDKVAFEKGPWSGHPVVADPYCPPGMVYVAPAKRWGDWS